MTTLNQLCDTIIRWLKEDVPANPHWSPATWETFQFVCLVHGGGPLLQQKLCDQPWLPPATREWLDQQYEFNSQRIRLMHAELKSILATFDKAGTPVMPLKGSIISVDYYADPGLRPMADLDLLIHPADVAQCAHLMGQLGYERDVVHWKHTEFIKPDNRQVASMTSEHPDNPRSVEVHAYCRENFGGPLVELTDLMWRHASEVELLGEKSCQPSVELLWLHVLVHASYHLWQGKGRLIHLLDVAQITPTVSDPETWLNELDGRFTYPALQVLANYFPDALPDGLLASQYLRVSSAFRTWTASLDLVNTSYLNPKPPGLYLPKALKFTEGRPYEIMQALRFSLLPSPEEMALDHPKLAKSKMPWLIYFLLPVDWTKRLIKK